MTQENDEQVLEYVCVFKNQNKETPSRTKLENDENSYPCL